MLRMSALALVTLVAACATQETAEGRDCFRSSQVNGFNVVDSNNVQISVGASRRYILTTNWNTHNLDFSQAIALRSSTGTICTGSGVGVDIIGGDPRQIYPIQSITRAPDRGAEG